MTDGTSLIVLLIYYSYNHLSVSLAAWLQMIIDFQYIIQSSLTVVFIVFIYCFHIYIIITIAILASCWRHCCYCCFNINGSVDSLKQKVVSFFVIRFCIARRHAKYGLNGLRVARREKNETPVKGGAKLLTGSMHAPACPITTSSCNTIYRPT